jgi:hypothetical protein
VNPTTPGSGNLGQEVDMSIRSSVLAIATVASALLISSDAEAAHLSWRAITATQFSFDGPYLGQPVDIALCPDGRLYEVTDNGAGQRFLLASDLDVTSTDSVAMTLVHAVPTTVRHVTCGGTGTTQRMTFQNGQALYSEAYDPANWGFAYSAPTTIGGGTPYAYTDDIKAMGASRIVAHNYDRYDFFGQTGGSWGTYVYAGDMWGAREIAAAQSTTGSSPIAFAINDDATMWVNAPLGSAASAMNVGWRQLPLEFDTLYVGTYAVDLEANIVGSTTTIVVLLEDGMIYAATYTP